MAEQSRLNKPLGAIPLLLIGIVLLYLGGVMLGSALGVACSAAGMAAIVASPIVGIGNARKRRNERKES